MEAQQAQKLKNAEALKESASGRLNKAAGICLERVLG